MCVVYNGSPTNIKVVVGVVTPDFHFAPSSDGGVIIGTCEEVVFGPGSSRIEFTSRPLYGQDEYSVPDDVILLANGDCAIFVSKA